MQDKVWADATRLRLKSDAMRLDALAQSAGWTLVGGTDLFRTYRAPGATVAQELLAISKIWVRIFPYDLNWLRLGLPGNTEWSRVSSALT